MVIFHGAEVLENLSAILRPVYSMYIARHFVQVIS